MDQPATKRSRHDAIDYDDETNVRGKPFIPGERKSTRQAQAADFDSGIGDAESSTSGRGQDGTTPSIGVSNGSAKRRPKGMKGYAYVPDGRPFEDLTPKEQKALVDQQARMMNGGGSLSMGHDVNDMDGAMNGNSRGLTYEGSPDE